MMSETQTEQKTHPPILPFHLRKWYLDAADEEGNLYIGYWASLHWHQINLYASQHLWHTLKDGVNSTATLGQQVAPCWQAEDKLCWMPQSVIASWQSVDRPLCETLLTTMDGSIYWQGFQPKARADIQHPALQLQSWGYTECIDITLPIWKLPVKKLYWGRCHTANHYVVWIKWVGNPAKTFVWHNGRKSNTLRITANQFQGEDFQLTIEQQVPLRRGLLISTIFNSLKTVTRLLPRSVFLADENKWYGHGMLETRNGHESATIIFEEINW